VPIVIRNAEIIAARNSTTMNPGTVDVAVFPPISVTDWTVDTLSDRIAEVRQLYVHTLADWPVDELPEDGLYQREKKPAPRKVPRTAQRKPAKAAKAAPAKAAAKKAVKAVQPRTPAGKAAKAAAAKKSTPRPKGPS
jgi:putative phosphoserine phosphatase / 1-acylglycerol-3-phosphate O-acyltransferase